MYQQISNVFLKFESEFLSGDPEASADTAVFVMVTTLLEKVLYPELTPAIACDDSAQSFAESLSHMLLAYFTLRK